MNFFVRHAGAAIGGAIVPPAIYFLATSVIFIPQHTPPAKQDLAPPDSPTPTVTPTPSETPTPSPSPTNSPTPKPTATSTPTYTPTPTRSPVTSSELDSWFTKYSNEYSVDRGKLWNIAVCESGLNPNARNGDYGGLYQFASGTWVSTRRAMSADTNADLRFSAEESIKTAAFRISTVGQFAWPNCSQANLPR